MVFGFFTPITIHDEGRNRVQGRRTYMKTNRTDSGTATMRHENFTSLLSTNLFPGAMSLKGEAAPFSYRFSTALLDMVTCEKATDK